MLEDDDDILSLESVSTSSDGESDDDMPDLVEVSDLDDEIDPSAESILESQIGRASCRERV